MTPFQAKKLAAFLVRVLGETAYLKLKYKRNTGRTLNLATPERFSEKLQWLKLHHRLPLMTQMADKIAAKTLVAQAIGSEHVIPLLKIFPSPNHIASEPPPALPVVLKTNHDSGGVKVVHTLQEWRSPALAAYFQKKLVDFYPYHVEWEYKGIPPRVFAEAHIVFDSGRALLQDFKVHCFDGVPRFVQTISDREIHVKENWFDPEWRPQDMHYFSPHRADVPRPANLARMLDLAATLSRTWPYVRVDFYTDGEQLFFGEFTFHPYGGFMTWKPDEADYRLGSLLQLPTA